MLGQAQREKIEELLTKLPGLEEQLGRPEVAADQKQFAQIARQHAHLSDLQAMYHELSQKERELREAKALLREPGLDPELMEEVHKEIALLEGALPLVADQLLDRLIPPDPLDDRATILELRAGTGGDEAALFVADMVRMYKLFADQKGWRVENLSATESDHGGLKECVLVVSGPQAYRLLRHEAGTHRVQRVPATEAQGRIHTSAATVAALLEPDMSEETSIADKDLRIDTCRSSGAGGQHVNTTDSAVRITHLPTGIVVFCQEERSQIKNRDKAMRVLRARIRDHEEAQRAAERSQLRSSMVGSGDRSERIRTYNFPQNRVTDHRINLTLYSLDRVMNGELEELVQALVQHYHRQRLEAAGLIL